MSSVSFDEPEIAPAWLPAPVSTELPVTVESARERWLTQLFGSEQPPVAIPA